MKLTLGETNENLIAAKITKPVTSLPGVLPHRLVRPAGGGPQVEDVLPHHTLSIWRTYDIQPTTKQQSIVCVATVLAVHHGRQTDFWGVCSQITTLRHLSYISSD
jgi:hypothetical protein